MREPGWALVVAAAMALTPGVAQAQVAHRFVVGPGDTVAVYEEGRGPAVVIVPGLLGSAYGFRHVTAALSASGLRVVVIDPLGTGMSARPERGDYTLEGQAIRVHHVLDSLGIPSATLLCHSVGGSICYRTALRAPGRVESIIAINAGPDERAATQGLRSAMRFAPLIRIMGSGAMRGRVRDGLVESSADSAWVTAEALAAYTAPFGDLGRALRGLRGMASAREPIALQPRLDQIAVPVLLLIGVGRDPLPISAGDLALLEREVPDFRVQRVPAAGQYIQEEQPAAVIEAVFSMRAAGARAAAARRPVD